MATIHVSKDKASIEPDKKVKFCISGFKPEQKLLDQEVVTIPVLADTELEFKACFSGWFEEPTSVEILKMAPRTSIHFQVFFDKKLRLREIHSTSAKKEATEKPIITTPSLGEQRTGILVSTTDKVLNLSFNKDANVGHALLLDGIKHPQRLGRGQLFIPLAPGPHTFQASMWPYKTHKYYFVLTTGQQLHYKIWSSAKSIHWSRMVGYEEMFDDQANNK